MRKLFLSFLLFFVSTLCFAGSEYSVAGLFPLANSGRLVYNFNQGWRFHLGDAQGAEDVDFNDGKWDVVCTPHSPLLTPVEGSGGRNYQGVCWYRKHFVLPTETNGKNAILHFEAVMGKQKIFVNGKLVKEHLGGYLPINIDLTACGVKPGDEALVAVMSDNSDDKNYPPGKKQSQLDFCYHGGIYRDVWLIAKSDVAITDAVERNQVAGGGIFIHYNNISERSAEMFIDVEIGSSLGGALPSTHHQQYVVQAKLKDADGKVVKTLKQSLKFSVNAEACQTARLSTKLNAPHLWSPEDPYLYSVEINVLQNGKSIDGGVVKTGVRSFEFKGQDGFWLNGKPYRQLVGGNRHQDFAYVGNAVPNSQQWRDVKRLKESGMNIIRVAHYPQDPSFMDACDEFGIFIIVATPGWQYWNKDPKFGELVHQNTREIIRRDRNHPCVLMWEPILNETRYPENFSLDALQITRDEYPYPYRPVAAADMHSAGVKDNYDVLYGWTTDLGKEGVPTDKCIFTREFGEMVDDWYAHNNLNRAARAWGEKPQLTTAISLNDTYNEMIDNRGQFIGGAQWHPFDHQRGYHPDTYYGGIYDAFRQKKYAQAMFAAMDDTQAPNVFIAHEMGPFSDDDVIVFSNCDSVRLTMFEGDKVETIAQRESKGHSVAFTQTYEGKKGLFVFHDFWHFWKARDYSYYQKNWQRVSLLAEGIKDGKVVCQQKKMPSRRSTKLRLYVDDMGKPLEADGSDFVVVVAEVTDDNGNVRRLAMDDIQFEVQGEGHIIGEYDNIGANPRRVEWGSAPILLQSTNTPGKITVIAHSWKPGATYALTPDTITIESVKPAVQPLYKEQPAVRKSASSAVSSAQSSAPAISEEERQRMLEEVNRQQMEFGIGY